jgi:hypothetical protein
LPTSEEVFMDSKAAKERRATSVDAEARRTFLKRVGKATATAPAVALLLSASSKAASAQSAYAPGDTAGDSECDPNVTTCGSGSS